MFKNSIYIGYNNGKAILYLENLYLDTCTIINTFTKPLVALIALNFKRRFKTYDFHKISSDVSFLYGFKELNIYRNRKRPIIIHGMYSM